MRYIKLFLILLITQPIKSQTTGILNFTVTTVNYPAQYSPKHILAIWITKSDGTWIKTLEFRSQNPSYRQHLVNFKNATNGTYNSIDAITGPTLPTHITHNVTWNGKDVYGNPTPDETYKICIEYTSANAPGKYFFFEWNKGTSPLSLTIPNQQYFTNISLNWTPDLTSINEQTEIIKKTNIFPNPFNDFIHIYTGTTNATIKIINTSGEIVFKYKQNGSLPVIWNGTNIFGETLSPGIYYCIIESSKKQTIHKIIKQ